MQSIPELPITAVIPLYNRPALVQEALTSIWQATARPAEILVVLNHARPVDAGPDLDAVQEWSRRHPSAPLRMLQCTTPGPAAARNQGIRAATTDWIALLDSDDLWLPEKLAAQWRYLAQRPHLYLCHCLEKWTKGGQTLIQPAELAPISGQSLFSAMRHCLISPSSLVFHRSVLNDAGYFRVDYPVCEDFELWLRILARFPVGLVPAELVVKRSADWTQLSQSRHSLDYYRLKALLEFATEPTNWPRSAQNEVHPVHALQDWQWSGLLSAAWSRAAILAQGQIKHRGRLAADLIRLLRQLKSL
ncbi:MAG: glycosyltransferase family 2 protein [Leptospiraceae bacterium]|nr:glycosyltransferase family 2 protein [Leptospiraceae bacterium]